MIFACLLLLLGGSYKAVLVVLEHCIIKFLAKFPPRVQLLVREEEEC